MGLPVCRRSTHHRRRGRACPAGSDNTDNEPVPDRAWPCESAWKNGFFEVLCARRLDGFPLLLTALCGGEHAAAKKIEAGPTVHVALDELQTIDVPFDRSGAPRFAQGGMDSVIILPQADGEAFDVTAFSFVDPGVRKATTNSTITFVSIRIHMARHTPKRHHQGVPLQPDSNNRSVIPCLSAYKTSRNPQLTPCGVPCGTGQPLAPPPDAPQPRAQSPEEPPSRPEPGPLLVGNYARWY